MHSPSACSVPTSCRTCVLHSPVHTSVVKVPSASMECHEHDACAAIGCHLQPDPAEYDEHLALRGRHNCALCPGTETSPGRLQSVSFLWCHHTCRCATISLPTCRQSDKTCTTKSGQAQGSSETLCSDDCTPTMCTGLTTSPP